MSELERALSSACNAMGLDARTNTPDYRLAEHLAHHTEAKLQAMRDVEVVRRIVANPEVRNMLAAQIQNALYVTRPDKEPRTGRERVDQVLDALNQLMDHW